MFELKVIEPRGSAFKVCAVQCAFCGAVVGVMDFVNIGTETATIKRELESLKSDVDTIRGIVRNIVVNVANIGNRR